MAGVLAKECSDNNSYEKEDKSDMRGEEGVCSGSISNLSHHIPLDLIFEILTRLPAKSLKRFQCVSKGWMCIIRNQVFIDSFFAVSQNRSRFLVSVRTAENRVILLSSSHNETEVPTTSLVNNLQMPIPGCRLNPIRYTSLDTNLETIVSGLPVDLVHCSSIHGLFSLYHPSDPGRFTICNPSTRQVITLPDITKASSGGINNIYMFLGYDPVGNEYKALCSMAGETYQEHKVLRIGGGGKLSWRRVKGRKFPHYIVLTNGICIDGMVYYGALTTQGQEKRFWILRFNVRGEGIDSIRAHSLITNQGSLINFNGKLAAVRPFPHAPRSSFDLWVLDDDFDGRLRWLRKYLRVHRLVFQLSGEIELKILGINKSNRVILGPLKLPPKHEPLYIYYYNKDGSHNLIRRVELKGFEEFGCNHTSDDQCVCQVTFSPEHFESLMSL